MHCYSLLVVLCYFYCYYCYSNYCYMGSVKGVAEFKHLGTNNLKLNVA